MLLLLEIPASDKASWLFIWPLHTAFITLILCIFPNSDVLLLRKFKFLSAVDALDKKPAMLILLGVTTTISRGLVEVRTVILL